MEIDLIIKHGVIGSIGLTMALLLISLKNPRLMLQDYPLSIRFAVPQKTKKEKRQTFLYGMPFLLILIGYPLAAGTYFAIKNSWNYWDSFSFTWGLSLFFNAYDLVILDWLIICTITPKMVVIPGTEGNRGYKDYKFHFVGFLKGVLITGAISLLISVVMILILRYRIEYAIKKQHISCFHFCSNLNRPGKRNNFQYLFDEKERQIFWDNTCVQAKCVT